MKNSNYPIPNSDQQLIIKSGVLKNIAQFRQLDKKTPEAGGQLFGHFDKNNIIISVATDPKPTDIRSRFSFIPNRRAERLEIQRMYESNLHFLGDWHTHPQQYPTPSSKDKQSMNDLFSCSTHQLGAMVMLIVGQEDPPMGLHVSLCDASSCKQLHSN